jgi:class 3 adenylate cyclase/tetratricopeptide (TPR) repeat protein
MTCVACGSENPIGRKFCMECGAQLALACPSCGAANPANAKFCGECGTGFSADTVSRAGSALTANSPRAEQSAERRLVSVLFADLVGFTTLSESRDAEEVRELLTRYFETCRRLIGLYGGTVEKFIGDAVMAVWGTPVATEDDAERAVRAALDLTVAVADLGTEVGSPGLRARAGVLTGEAAVTIGAEGQGMVAGDLVNTASRIQSAAPAGGVYVGETTRRATEAAIVYEDAGAFELKGKAEPLPLWRALRVVAGARGGLKSTGLEAPFAGRDRELRNVKGLFFGSAEDGKAHLVSIMGVAGIGKSRLAWEFYKYFDGLPQITYYHRGRCLSYGEGVAYWALVEMVKMRARIAEVEDPVSAAAKLHASVEEHVPDPEERKWVEPRLAHLIGLEESPGSDREDLFAAWRLFFERLAEENPTVMVFEDVQWADASLVDFIEYLLEWSRNFPIFVLTLARPEFLDRRPSWGAGRRNFTSLFLEPLSPEAMGELLHGLVPGLPDDLSLQILERAQGIPLYAVETVRMLLDRGLLTQEGSVYKPTGPISSLEVPETLHALIAARLDGLTPEERRLIQDASVLGKTFFQAGLAAVSGTPEDELEPLLASLVRKEILSLQADSRSPERGQHGFLQDLVRKVAYETLSRRDRKAKHLAAASFIEEGWGGEEEEIVEVVASHYLQAYQADPTASDATGIRGKARDMLARAGERAASLTASEEAQRYFEQAIELADETLLQAELHERAGRMAWSGGRADQARSHYERAIASFESIQLTHPAARVAAALAEVTWDEGRIEDAVAQMERAFAVLAGEEPDQDVATLAAQLGRFLWLTGSTGAAMDRVELALAIAESLRLHEVLSQALNTKGVLLSSRGRPEEGSTLVRRALEIAVEHGLSSAALRAYNNDASLLSYRDLHQELLASAQAGLDLARKVGDRQWALLLEAAAVSSLVSLGRWDEAVERSAEIRGLEVTQRLSSYPDLLTLVQVYVHRGELKEAWQLLALFPDAEESQDVQVRAAYQAARAALLRAEGDLVDALGAGEEAIGVRVEIGVGHPIFKDGLVEALEAALELGDKDKVESLLLVIEGLKPGELSGVYRAQGARFGARLAALRGEPDKVEPGFRAAVSGFRELSMPFWLAVTLLELGEWIASQSRAVEVEPLLGESREIFERLRARPWLERLERLPSAVRAGAGAEVSP